MKGKDYLGIVISILAVLLIAPLIQTTIVQMMPIVYASPPEDADNWSMFGHDLARQSHSLSSAPSNDNVRWVWNTTSEIVTSPAIADGYAVVACINGEIIGFNATTGTKIWTYQIEGQSNLVWSSPAIDSGRVFVGARNNNLYCLNQSTGALIWTFVTGGPVNSSPLVKDGRVFFSSNDGKFYCLNSIDGSLIWEHNLSNSTIDNMPSPAIDDKMIVVGSGTNVRALNASTGDEIWNYSTGPPGTFLGPVVTSSPAISEGRIYFGSSQAMVCIDTSGSLIWTTTNEGGSPAGDYIYLSSPAVANGRVFIGSDNGDVYSFNATTGVVLWQYPTGRPIWSSPAVADGKVFIGSEDGKIYCLNETTGDLIWDKFTLGRVASSPAIAEGTVFVGCGGVFEGGRIYAFGPDETLPSTITLSLDTTTTYLGFKVTLSGQLKGNGAGIDEAPVLLSYSVNEGQNWNDITLALTSNGGLFSADWIAVATGRFMVRASWEGDYPFLGQETIRMLSVTPYEELYMFSVSSNSILSELAFNSTSRELSFTASGEDGTKGYVKASIAKELVSNITDLKVYLDGNNLDYTVTSTESSWILNFDYSHSTHSVVVHLGELNGDIPESASAIPKVILSDKEIIPNPANTSSIAFTATVESPTTTNIWFQIKATFDETGIRHSQCIENVMLENSTRLTIEWTYPDDPRFDRLPTIEGTNVYMVDPYWFNNWISNWVYAITTVYDVWENASTGYLIELKPSSTGPAIRILSPQWEEYTATDVPLIFTVDQPTDWIGYSLDGQANVTITGNTTLTDLSVGWHDIMVYANDTSGNMGFSDPRSADWVHFTVSELAIGVVIDSNVNFTRKYVTRNAMNFNVSGPAGLIGYINITFPKINTTEIVVFIDDIELVLPFPIINTNGTHYFIYFEFTLSTHTIKTQFAPLAPPPTEQPTEPEPSTENSSGKGENYDMLIILLVAISLLVVIVIVSYRLKLHHKLFKM
ncbi:MAG: PQQ-binding-like beta-propeller repeat protein [Candidatus Bathyarchaeum sp.]|nr:MAG: PQQ-binding-like beta-propeller repeat protein [Candidatus Bathyarchaeum sp.]